MVTVVNISADSLLDYMLHSRVRLLERLLGADIYAIMFEGGQRREKVVSNASISTEPQVQQQLSVRTVNLSQHCRPSKYRSQLLLNAYWRAKIRSSSYSHRLEPLKGAPSSSYVAELAIDTRADTLDSQADDRRHRKYKRLTRTRSVDTERLSYSAELSLTSIQLPLLEKEKGDVTADIRGSAYVPSFKGGKEKMGAKSLPCLPSVQHKHKKIKEDKKLSPSDCYMRETHLSQDCKQNRMSAGDTRGNVHFTSPAATNIDYKHNEGNRKNVKKVANKKRSNKRRSILPPSSDKHISNASSKSHHHLTSFGKATGRACLDTPGGLTNLDLPDDQGRSDLSNDHIISNLSSRQTSIDLPDSLSSSNLPFDQLSSDLLCSQASSDLSRSQASSDLSRGQASSDLPCSQVNLELECNQTKSNSSISQKRLTTPVPTPSITTDSIPTGPEDGAEEILHNSKGNSKETDDSSSYQLDRDLSDQSNSQSNAWKTYLDMPHNSSREKAKIHQSGKTKQAHNGKRYVRNSATIVAPLNNVNRDRLPVLSGYINMQSQQPSGLVVDQSGKQAMTSKDVIGIPSLQSAQPSLHAIASTHGKPLMYNGVKPTSPSTAAMRTTLDSKSMPTNSNKKIWLDPAKLQRGLNAKELEHCSTCGLGLWKMQPTAPTFFNLTLIMLTFAETNKNHYTTISKTVDSMSTLYGLIQLIKHEQDIASNTIRIYKDKSRLPSSILPPSSTLEDCGYEGSSEWYQPTDLTLYYDYDSDYYDCPILISDFYFINRKRHLAVSNS